MAQNISRVEDLDVGTVVRVLQIWQMSDFVDFVVEKQVDGRKLLEVTEGIVKLWRPKANAKIFVQFIQDLKMDPEKYLNSLHNDQNNLSDVAIECQYQSVRKTKYEHTSMSLNGVEDLLKRIVPAKSFLYRNQQQKTEKGTSYVPMEGTPKKPRRFFRLSSYEYPRFDFCRRSSKQENFHDRGYYSVKTNTRYFIQKISKQPEMRTKYNSISTAEEFNDRVSEDHFYEDLCYNDIETEKTTEVSNTNVKPTMVKIQELFQSFKFPFFRKNEAVLEGNKTAEREDKKPEIKDMRLYENSDSLANMYDSVHANIPVGSNMEPINNQTKIVVEDYLEPIHICKDYCDVNYKQKDESLLGYIISIFENRFGLRRETNDPTLSEDSVSETHEDRKWGEERKPSNMAERPLPVPVESEPYYMNVDRNEAENLLRGQPDGTFILRPSSQPNHAYTLSVSCGGTVHNVGVRHRGDGRLALGFARRAERTFASVGSLLRHHRKRRLMLVAAGDLLGATTLNEAPQYYQTPNNLPIELP